MGVERVGALLQELKSLPEPARLQRVESFLAEASGEERTAFALVFLPKWQPEFGRSPALVALRREMAEKGVIVPDAGRARATARELLTIVVSDAAREDKYTALLSEARDPATAELVLINMLTFAATAVKLAADAQGVKPEQALARVLGH